MTPSDALRPIAPTPPTALSAEHAQLLADAEEVMGHARSESTRRIYRAEWARFTSWCAEAEYAPLPAHPTVVVMYLEHLKRRRFKASTIGLALVVLGNRHRAANLPNPRDDETVRVYRQGMRNVLGVAPRQVKPLVIEELRLVVGALPETLGGTRDRALLLLGFAGALRESELVALRVEDVEIRRGRAIVTIRKSKTDQGRKGQVVGFPKAGDAALCPIASLRAWLAAARVRTGPIFRAVDRWGNVGDAALWARHVDTIVKRSVKLAGIDPTDYAGHSLRAGLVTSAGDAGHPIEAIAKHTRHESLETTRIYLRRADLFRGNVVANLL